MGKKKPKQKNQIIAKPSPVKQTTFYNYQEFKARNTFWLLIVAGLLMCLLLFSIFKNISYPLFWADESMTAMGTERVLEFGYPKVHDGKNVFYDLRHSNPALGINEKDDAYVGGTGWGHYYYGVIGYKLAELTDNLYSKTGIYRSSYAIAGLLGLGVFIILICKILPDPFSRYAFISLFLLFSLMSVTLALLIREVRYYSLVFLLSSVILGAYCSFRLYRPFNKILLVVILTLSLWLLFNTFAPVFFIMIASIGLSESIVAIDQFRKTDLKRSVMYVLPVFLSLTLSLLAVYPLLLYFKTFEISQAMKEFNNYGEKYWENVSIAFRYLKNFELLWLAIAFKVLLMIHFKQFIREKAALLRISAFLTLFFIIYLFAIARIPNFLYTRYIIYLQPVLSIIIILDFFLILKYYSIQSTRLISVRMIIPFGILAGFIFYTLASNFKYIKGHAYELIHVYKGPLDYTIPYINENYPAPENLVIATNYEETSFMYYLKSRVIMGYVGNNLAQDSIVDPDIIAYRKIWGNHAHAFNGFVNRAIFEPVKFPVKDIPLNNIPELNFMPPFNHYFMTPMAGTDGEATFLHIKK